MQQVLRGRRHAGALSRHSDPPPAAGEDLAALGAVQQERLPLGEQLAQRLQEQPQPAA